MFKKERDLAERSKTLLKNKEVRNLKADIVKKFQNVSEEELNAVIPNKADITVTKLANKTLLYSIGGVTLLFDIEGRGNLCPALPFLWRFPNALPTYVIHSPVSEFVLRGADLMIPGICKSKIADLQSAGLKEGSKASIRVAGNPLPFAVGDSLVSGESLASGKLRGRAVTVLHVYGDLISTASVVPNSGFGPSRIYALEGFTEPGAGAEGGDAYDSDEDSDAESTGDADGAEQAEADEVAAVVSGVSGVTVSDALESSVPEADVQGGDREGCTDEDGADGDAQEVVGDADNEEEERAAGEDLQDAAETGGGEVSRAEAAEAQNALLLQAVLLASKYVVKDKQLPMLVSTYWALIQRCAAAAEIGRLDIKQSSYRKVTSFLAHCAALDLLALREENGVSTVTKLNKTHDLFRGVKVDNPELFKTTVLSAAAVPAVTEEAAGSSPFLIGGNNTTSSTVGGGKNAISGKVQVLELFKLTKHLRDVFGTPRGEYGEYLRAGEVRDILVMYIKSHSLEDAQDKSCVVIPPSDAVHPLLASYSSANTTKNANTSAKASTQPVTAAEEDREGPAQYSEDLELEAEIEEEGYPAAGGFAPGRMFGAGGGYAASSSGGEEIRMKIHSGGLRSVDDAAASAPAASAAPAATTAAPARLAGGSSVGGWGVDKGTEWKPVTLSTARAVATQSAALEREFPALGSGTGKGAGSGAQRAKASGGAKSKAAVYSELPTDLHLRKEDVFKALLKKTSPYFGVISHTGSVSVHSGQVPKAKILVEARMGNKAVTILRGLEVFGIDLAQLTKDCQKKFACSVALSSVPGIPKDKEIVVQGNLGFEAEAYLAEHCGVPKHLIELDASKGGKLKKRK